MLLSSFYSLIAMEALKVNEELGFSYSSNKISAQELGDTDFLYGICCNLRYLRNALDSGLSPNTSKFPLLLSSLTRGSTECAKELVARGASVNQGHVTASIRLRDNALFNDLLFRCHFDRTKKAHENKTPVHTAAGFGTPEMVEKFLEMGIPLESQDNFGYTPLFDAVAQGNILTIKKLMSKDANLHAKTNAGESVLMRAEKVSPLIAKNIKQHMRVQTYLACGKQLPIEITDHIASFYN